MSAKPECELAESDTGRAFLAICEALADAGDELTIEEWAVFYATFAALRRGGVQFDAAFISRVEEINRTVRNTGADSDSDASDEGIENELAESFIQGG